MYNIQFTKEALHDLTQRQAVQISLLMAGEVDSIFVSKDFSLPSDYMALQINYRHGNVIFGGMDAEGVLST